jgi:aspartyl-tRNA(Asn)/glutamyl-tRNA(Gln) amidotransferase subunit A
MTPLWKTDAVALAAAVRAKDVSAVELAKAALGRIEKLDGTLHAFCTPTPDIALKEAAAVDAAIAAGAPVGPLAGVPYGIKDLICTKDVRTMSGAAAYADFVPDEDDVVVERMRSAGAVSLGKTNVPEYGYSGVGHNPVCETTVNPWNIERTSGGSSAGSGAAVAAGLCPLALGSDGGGSVRIPASFCGLVGIKASMGRVPLYPGTKDERYPGVSSWESLEHIGPMTRTAFKAAKPWADAWPRLAQ